MTKKYTMSPAAHAVRKAASAKAAKARPPGKRWKTVSLDEALVQAIAATQHEGESLAAAIRRKYGIKQ